MVLTNLKKRLISIASLFISTILFLSCIFLLPDVAQSTTEESHKKLSIIILLLIIGFTFWCISYILYKEIVIENV